MMFPTTDCFDVETSDVMAWALDTALEEVELALAKNNAFDLTGLRTLMEARIVAAVRDGERDLDHLKQRALKGIADVNVADGEVTQGSDSAVSSV